VAASCPSTTISPSPLAICRSRVVSDHRRYRAKVAASSTNDEINDRPVKSLFHSFLLEQTFLRVNTRHFARGSPISILRILANRQEHGVDCSWSRAKTEISIGPNHGDPRPAEASEGSALMYPTLCHGVSQSRGFPTNTAVIRRRRCLGEAR